MSHWQTWHTNYDVTSSSLAQRLQVVQAHIRAALDDAPPGPIRAVSMCTGDGRDLLGVLGDHPRRHDVVARLIEWDPSLADGARRAAAGLPRIEVVTGDAASIDRYAGAIPADLVLTCGVFGNITDEDVRATIDAHRSLCAHGATVIWTRHRREPDLVPQICAWFAEYGFELISISEPDLRFGVGVHRYRGEPRPAVAGTHMFTFGQPS